MSFSPELCMETKTVIYLPQHWRKDKMRTLRCRFTTVVLFRSRNPDAFSQILSKKDRLYVLNNKLFAIIMLAFTVGEMCKMYQTCVQLHWLSYAVIDLLLYTQLKAKRDNHQEIPQITNQSTVPQGSHTEHRQIKVTTCQQE